MSTSRAGLRTKQQHFLQSSARPHRFFTTSKPRNPHVSTHLNTMASNLGRHVLQSSENSSSWRRSLCPNDSTEPLCLTRNCIKFQFLVRLPGTITLVDAFSHFEVYINAPLDACVALCPSIWCILFRGIEKAKETLQYHALVEPKRAFLCKHGSDCYTRPTHLAFPADRLNYWRCEIDPETMYGCLSSIGWGAWGWAA